MKEKHEVKSENDEVDMSDVRDRVFIGLTNMNLKKYENGKFHGQHGQAAIIVCLGQVAPVECSGCSPSTPS